MPPQCTVLFTEEEIDVGEILLTVNEAASRLAIGRTTLYELIANQELRSVKIGRARRIPESSVDEWIARHLNDQRRASTLRAQDNELTA